MADSSFTLTEWCTIRKVSRSKFYELDAEGKAPRSHYAGVKRLIGPEADRDWLREREAEAALRTWAEPLSNNPADGAEQTAA